MPDLPIHLTCADYARLMPLARGEVGADGIALTLSLGHNGSWSDRAEMLRRALHDPEVSGGEASMCVHLMRLAAGDRSFVGLPVFPLRNFTFRDLYVRKGGPIASVADLAAGSGAGKRIGMYGWANSGAVWYRHMLGHLGIDIHALRWWIGPIDTPRPTTSQATLPPGVQEPAPGRSLSAMLIDGELDAILSPPRPQAYHRTDGPIIRLFPDYRQAEAVYFRATGIFPPQHLIVLRRAVWDANPWIAPTLTDAFIRCNQAFTAAQRSFPYATPWLEDELEATEAEMGPDFHPYGFDANRQQLATFAEQAHRAGIVDRTVPPEEYFAEYLQSRSDV